MTKEEKIKKAWGLNYDEFSEYIDSDGWARYPHFQKHEMVQDVRPIEFRSQGTDFRPKSLQGIENNNGWIKIESEKDLPKNSINKRKLNEHYYVFSTKKGKIEWKPTNLFGLHSMWSQGDITHYQPIEKPKLPIY